MPDAAVPLALFDDLAELRDAALILAGIAASALALIFLIFVVKASLVAYRIVRRLQRFHDNRVAGGVEAADDQLAAWLEADRWSARGLLELIQLAGQQVRARRAPPPKKRRLFGLLPPA